MKARKVLQNSSLLPLRVVPAAIKEVGGRRKTRLHRIKTFNRKSDGILPPIHIFADLSVLDSLTVGEHALT